ncbi:MAG: hypothetical protein HW417_1919 [Steroidobacteraceae bacterium]|nr:hypothetical protein [Steroidobacteraceae bacterium]
MSTWAPGLFGGALIGLSATLLLWSIGRIAGISGIVNGLGSAPRSDRAWRAAFLIGLMTAGAVAVTAIAFRFVLRLPQPVLGTQFRVPTDTTIDRPLLLGSAIFGVGWALIGYCPGPVFVMRHLLGAQS